MKIGTAMRKLASVWMIGAVLVPMALWAVPVRQTGVTNGTKRTECSSGFVNGEKRQKKKNAETPPALITAKKSTACGFIDGNNLSVTLKSRLRAEFPFLQSQASLFGSVVYAASWPLYGNKPYGLYLFDLADGSEEWHRDRLFPVFSIILLYLLCRNSKGTFFPCKVFSI